MLRHHASSHICLSQKQLDARFCIIGTGGPAAVRCDGAAAAGRPRRRHRDHEPALWHPHPRSRHGLPARRLCGKLLKVVQHDSGLAELAGSTCVPSYLRAVSQAKYAAKQTATGRLCSPIDDCCVRSQCPPRVPLCVQVSRGSVYSLHKSSTRAHIHKVCWCSVSRAMRCACGSRSVAPRVLRKSL